MKDDSITVYSIGHNWNWQTVFFPLFLLFLIVPVEFNLNSSHDSKYFFSVSSTATPTPDVRDGLFRMELDRETFIPPCQPDYRCSHSNADSAPIVVTIFNTKRADGFRYDYTITGGHVIGKGAKVNWDLTGAPPGTYQITVAVLDKAGKEIQTATRTVSVFPYKDDGDRCLGVCSSLSVDAPSSSVQAGEMMTFKANASRVILENLTYDWTVSDGEIIEGQGTPVIRVATNPQMAGKTVEATVNFKWDGICWDICEKTASASGSVAAKKNKGK